MVHKRYIKRDGKVFGPYFYKSVRIGDTVKNIYLGTAKKLKKKEAILAVSLLFLVLFFLQTTTAETTDGMLNANLTIWDNTDNSPSDDRYSNCTESYGTCGGTPSKTLNYYTVNFYANYSNLTVGAITGNCTIRFNYTGTYTPFKYMNYSATTKLYQFNMTFDRRGNFTFQINCSNSSYDNLNVTDDFEIKNTPPYQLLGIGATAPTQACIEDQICIYDTSYNFTDDDLNDLPLTSFTNPNETAGFASCLSLDTSTGIMTVACTDSSQEGSHYFISYASDGIQTSSSIKVPYTITATNDIPIIKFLDTECTGHICTCTEDTLCTVYIDASDEEDGDITSGAGAVGNMSFYLNDTSLFNISSTTGLINFTPSNSDVGIYYYDLAVNDTQNATNYTVMTFIVQDQNDPPNITFACNNSLEQIEDGNFSCYINATDIDADETHTFSANYSWFNFSCSSVAVVNGNTSCLVNFAPTDIAVYSHWINITVEDSGGLKDSVVINFSVANVPDIPYFVNISNMSAWADAPFWFQINATDDDILTEYGESIYYWDNTSLFNIGKSTGIISFTPSNSQNGTYWINISVNDSTDRVNSTIINFTIYTNYPPNYSGHLEYNATEGYAFSLNISMNSSDADGDALSFSDNTTLFDIDAQGIISFTANDSQVKTHWIDINITDSHGATSTFTFNFTVYNEDDPPELSTISNVTDAYEGVLVSFTLTATDPDLFVPDTTDYLRFRMNSTVSGMSLDSATGQFTWTPSAIQSGFYWINFTVNDTTGSEDSQLMFINITDATYPPRFLDTEVFFCTKRNASEDVEFDSCIIWACDNDTDATLRFAANYSWFTFNTSTLTTAYYAAYGYCANTTVNFTPTYAEVGNWSITLNVTDNLGNSVTTNISFNISSINDAPVLALIPTRNLIMNQLYSYNISANATDEENDVLNFFANGTISAFNVTLNRTTGMLIGTPNSSMNGTYRVNISVNDTFGAEHSRVVVFSIGENSAPKCSAFFAITPNKTIMSQPDEFNMSENQSTGNFVVTCLDKEEGDDFTYQWYWNGTFNYSSVGLSGNTWSYRTTFLDSGTSNYTMNVTLVVNDTATNSNTYYWNVTVFNINAPPMLYGVIGNISTTLSGSGWYKNVVNSRNMTTLFFDFDNDNLTYGWYRYAINESFDDGLIASINSSWNLPGTWSLINHTSNNPSLWQNDSSSLQTAYFKAGTFSAITEFKVKLKIISRGAAGLCFGNVSCTSDSLRIFLNMSDNTTNLEYTGTDSVFNNSYSVEIANTSYLWLKAEFYDNVTVAHISSDGETWNFTYNMSVNYTFSSSSISLFTVGSEAIFDDIVLKDPDLKNMTVSNSGGDTISFTPAAGWFGDLPMTLTANDGYSVRHSNIFYLHIDDVTSPEPVTVTQTLRSSSTTQLTKIASLDIIVPSMISLTPLSKTIVPIILNNSGQINLNLVDLIALTNQSSLKLILEGTNWTILGVGESVATNMEIDIGLLSPDRYTIKLKANSKTPLLHEEAEIIIDVREKDAVLKAQLKEQIQFTRDLFLQNPECLELWELIEEAERLMNRYDYEEGIDLIHTANQGCKDFLAMDREKVTKKKVKTFLEEHWRTILLEVIGLLIAVLLLIYYFRRRRFRKPI